MTFVSSLGHREEVRVLAAAYTAAIQYFKENIGISVYCNCTVTDGHQAWGAFDPRLKPYISVDYLQRTVDAAGVKWITFVELKRLGVKPHKTSLDIVLAHGQDYK